MLYIPPLSASPFPKSPGVTPPWPEMTVLPSPTSKETAPNWWVWNLTKTDSYGFRSKLAFQNILVPWPIGQKFALEFMPVPNKNTIQMVVSRPNMGFCSRINFFSSTLWCSVFPQKDDEKVPDWHILYPIDVWKLFLLSVVVCLIDRSLVFVIIIYNDSNCRCFGWLYNIHYPSIPSSTHTILASLYH